MNFSRDRTSFFHPHPGHSMRGASFSHHPHNFTSSTIPCSPIWPIRASPSNSTQESGRTDKDSPWGCCVAGIRVSPRWVRMSMCCCHADSKDSWFLYKQKFHLILTWEKSCHLLQGYLLLMTRSLVLITSFNCYFSIQENQLGIVVGICNPSLQKTEAGEIISSRHAWEI